MTSRERIKATLEFRAPDCVGIYDNFCEETLKLWHTQGLDEGCEIQDYFDFDFRLFESEKDLETNYKRAKDQNRFIIFSTSGPFERVKRSIGLEDVLVALSHQPKLIEEKIGKDYDSIIEEYIYLKGKGFLFDGFWFWEDIAYQNGLLFSRDTYKRILFDFHKRLCRFFRNEGMAVIYHSDGDMREIIPLLIDAGISALHPLENSCGMDIRELKREYKKDLALFGNIDTHKLSQTKEEIDKEIQDKLSAAREGGYIYCCDSPIPKTVSLDNYKFTLETVKKTG